MNTQYAKYESLKNLNPFNMTEVQYNLIVAIQKEHAGEFRPLAPIEARKAPFATKYKSAKDVIRDIKEIKSDKSLTPELQRKKMSRIWGSLSKELVQNEKEMRALCKYEPRAAALIPEKNITPEFAASLILEHTEIYDLLSEGLKKNNVVIDAYRDSLLKELKLSEGQFHTIGEHKRNVFFTDLDGVAVVRINPNCPIGQLIANEDAVAKIAEHVIRGGYSRKGGSVSWGFEGSKIAEIIPSNQVLLALAQYQFSPAAYERAVNRAIDASVDVIIKNSINDPKYKEKVLPLLERLDRKDVVQSIEFAEKKKEDQKQKQEIFKEKIMFPYEKENKKDLSNAHISPINEGTCKNINNDLQPNKDNNGMIIGDR